MEKKAYKDLMNGVKETKAETRDKFRK